MYITLIPGFECLRSSRTSTTTSSSKSFRESTQVTKITFSKETKSESSETKVPENRVAFETPVSEDKVPEIVERGRPRVRRVPIEFCPTVKSDKTEPTKQALNFGNQVPEKLVLPKPIDERLVPVKAVVKIGHIEPTKYRLTDALKFRDEAGQSRSEAAGQNAPTGQATYRDYLVSKRQIRRPLSCDGSSAFSR
jgi:hypothetical protein